MISSLKPQHTSLTSGFTLVELIAVITIVAILSTMGFISYSKYITEARDSARYSQMKNLSDALQVHSATKDLPLPDNSIAIKVDSEIVGYQGDIGKSVLESIGFVGESFDPKDKEPFTYYITKDKKASQLMALMEEQNIFAFIPQTHAGQYDTRIPVVYGKGLGIITDEDNTPVHRITSFQTNGFNLSNQTDTYNAYISNTETISGSGSKLLAANPDGSCKRMKQTGRGSNSGIYKINPDSTPIQVYCDMDTDGGGWTKVIRINRGDTTWNAYTTDENTPGDLISGSGGLMISQFSFDSDGEDLEYMFTVDGVQKGPIYTQVDSQMWDNTMGSSYFDDTFYYKNIGDTNFTLCDNGGIMHANSRYNWSITKGGGTACNQQYSGGGFLAFGVLSGAPDKFDRLFGLNTYNNSTDWESMSVFVR